MNAEANSSPSLSAQQHAREEDLARRVANSFAACDDDRLKTLMVELVRHLHAYLREVRLTEAEWAKAIDFLARCGHMTGGRRQELILLSDVLGASMQTITINNGARSNATEATVFGPFFVPDSPQVQLGGDISNGAVGEPCWVEGTVTDIAGTPLASALIEVWEADAEGLYDVQYDDNRVAGRAHLRTDDEGRFRFWAITPTPYPIPSDGPVGQLLEAVGRSPMRASHLHFMVKHPGYRTLVTHIFPEGDEFLGSDSVFGVKDSLIREFTPQPAGTPAPGGRGLVGQRWSRVRFDIVLASSFA